MARTMLIAPVTLEQYFSFFSCEVLVRFQRPRKQGTLDGRNWTPTLKHAHSLTHTTPQQSQLVHQFFFERQLCWRAKKVIFKMSGFTPYWSLAFGYFFWALLLKMSGFTPCWILAIFGPPPWSPFWPSKMTPQHLNTSTPQHLNTSTPQHLNTSTPQHLNTSTPQHLNTSTPQHLNTSTPQHLNTWTPEHLNGHKPCFCENVAGLRLATFFTKKHGLYCLSRSQCLSLFYFCLSWFSSMLFSLISFVLRSLSILPASMVLDILEGQRRGRGPKISQNSSGVKTSRK